MKYKYGNTKEVHKMTVAAVKAFLNIAKKWQLNEEEQIKWADINHETLEQWKKHEIDILHEDGIYRLGLALSIYKNLQILFSNSAIADTWLSRPNNNEIYAGNSALHYIMENGLEGMETVARHLA